MAGTATEQLVGLGKPVLTQPSEQGPQFNYRFAEAQVRLLGEESVSLCNSIQALADAIGEMSRRFSVGVEDEWRQSVLRNAASRMGYSGASERIAYSLLDSLW